MKFFASLLVFCLLVELSLSAPIRMWSTPQTSMGDVRIYVDEDATTGAPTAVGLRLAEANVESPPKEASTMYFEMPTKADRVTPFVEIDLVYEPATKKKDAMYYVYFYMLPKGGSISRVTPGDCQGVSVEGFCRSTQLLPAPCCPTGYLQSADTKPFVGSELIYPADFAHSMFTRTLTFGTLDGMIHFYSMQISAQYLASTQTLGSPLCIPIPGMPSQFKFPGFYPTTYCFSYKMSAFYFELNTFVPYSAGCTSIPNSCAPPKKTIDNLPKKCNCAKAFPSFIPVPPPAGTGLSTSSTTMSTMTSMSSMSSTQSSMSSQNSMSSMSSQSSMSSMSSQSSMSSMSSQSSMSTMSSMNSSMNATSSDSAMDGGFLFLIMQPSIHLLYMVSLAIIGFFFLIIAVAFSLYGITVSIALIRAEKNNRQLSLILKMIFITALLSCIFAARCALIIWEDLVMRHEVDSNYLWRSYFLPEIIPALLILLLDILQVFNEKKKAIAASMATLGFMSKTRDSTTATMANTKTTSHTKSGHQSGQQSSDTSSHSAH